MTKNLLKLDIDQNIYDGYEENITGDILNTILNDMVDVSVTVEEVDLKINIEKERAIGIETGLLDATDVLTLMVDAVQNKVDHIEPVVTLLTRDVTSINRTLDTTLSVVNIDPVSTTNAVTLTVTKNNLHLTDPHIEKKTIPVVGTNAGIMLPLHLTTLNNTANDLATHTANLANPHLVTKALIGLSNVDNTADSAKPLSDAANVAIGNINGVDVISSLTYTPANQTTSMSLLYTLGKIGATKVANSIDFLNASSTITGPLNRNDWSTFNNKVTSVTSGSPNVIITGTTQNPVITVSETALPDKFISTESPTGVIGNSLTTNESTLTPLIVNELLSINDNITFANGYQGQVTALSGTAPNRTVTYVLIFIPTTSAWGNIGGNISTQVDLIDRVDDYTSSIDIATYDTTHQYVEGDFTEYNGDYYVCTTSSSTVGAFNSDEWLGVDKLTSDTQNTAIDELIERVWDLNCQAAVSANINITHYSYGTYGNPGDATYYPSALIGYNDNGGIVSVIGLVSDIPSTNDAPHRIATKGYVDSVSSSANPSQYDFIISTDEDVATFVANQKSSGQKYLNIFVKAKNTPYNFITTPIQVPNTEYIQGSYNDFQVDSQVKGSYTKLILSPRYLTTFSGGYSFPSYLVSPRRHIDLPIGDLLNNTYIFRHLFRIKNSPTNFLIDPFASGTDTPFWDYCMILNSLNVHISVLPLGTQFIYDSADPDYTTKPCIMVSDNVPGANSLGIFDQKVTIIPDDGLDLDLNFSIAISQRVSSVQSNFSQNIRTVNIDIELNNTRVFYVNWDNLLDYIAVESSQVYFDNLDTTEDWGDVEFDLAHQSCIYYPVDSTGSETAPQIAWGNDLTTTGIDDWIWSEQADAAVTVENITITGEQSTKNGITYPYPDLTCLNFRSNGFVSVFKNLIVDDIDNISYLENCVLGNPVRSALDPSYIGITLAKTLKSCTAYQSNITARDITDLTIIGNSQLQDCDNISGIRLTEVYTFTRALFINCNNLSNLTLANCTLRAGYEGLVTRCQNVSNILISGVYLDSTYYPLGLFAYCLNLVNLKLDDIIKTNLNGVEDYVFQNCESISNCLAGLSTYRSPIFAKYCSTISNSNLYCDYSNCLLSCQNLSNSYIVVNAVLNGLSDWIINADKIHNCEIFFNSLQITLDTVVVRSYNSFLNSRLVVGVQNSIMNPDKLLCLVNTPIAIGNTINVRGYPGTSLTIATITGIEGTWDNGNGNDSTITNNTLVLDTTLLTTNTIGIRNCKNATKNSIKIVGTGTINKLLKDDTFSCTDLKIIHFLDSTAVNIGTQDLLITNKSNLPNFPNIDSKDFDLTYLLYQNGILAMAYEANTTQANIKVISRTPDQYNDSWWSQLASSQLSSYISSRLEPYGLCYVLNSSQISPSWLTTFSSNIGLHPSGIASILNNSRIIGNDFSNFGSAIGSYLPGSYLVADIVYNPGALAMLKAALGL